MFSKILSIDLSSSERLETKFIIMKKKLLHYLIYSLVLILNISFIYCHGMLMDPVNRGSAWRLGFNTPVNYDDNANYCGGANVIN